MERFTQVSEQRLLQTSVDLRNQLAEVQKLRKAIQSAEASERSRRLGRSSRVSEYRPVKPGQGSPLQYSRPLIECLQPTLKRRLLND